MARAKAQTYQDNLEYLQQELEWVEQRCRRITIQRKIGMRTGEVEPTGRWSSHSEESLEELRKTHRRLQRRENTLRAEIDKRLAATRAAGFTPALDQLVEMYALDGFERSIVLLAAAVVFSRRFENLYGELEETYSTLNVEVIFNFCELPFAERVTRRATFAGTSALVQNDLISVDLASRFTGPEDLLVAQVRLSSRTFGFLVGDDALNDEFLEFSSLEEPMATFDQVVLAPADKSRILSVVERHDEYLKYRAEWGFDEVIRYGKGVLMLFHGKPGTGKTMMAHAVAEKLGKRVLNVDIPTFIENHQADRFLPSLFKEARLQNALLFFDECEVLLGDRRYGNKLMTLLLTEIERFEGIAVLATNLPQALDQALDRRILVKVRFPEPDRLARREIWQRHLPARAPLADDVDLDYLADTFDMTGGYIKNAVLAAVAAAVHQNGAHPVITMAHLEAAARDQTRPPLDETSNLVVPSARLKDVILSEALKEQVSELIDAARHRRTILERWGIGEHLTYGKGVAALFHGVPGTGKTLCAEAIANELNRPLLVASAAGIKSKWVGETERNLARLFDDARAGNAVLFLDEADTFLRARGEGRASRHDDDAVNVLLTQIERFDGVVLLATNREAELDTALERRLTYTLEFTVPGTVERARIWQALLPEAVPTAGDLDFDQLAKRYPLTGALIKNAVFKAAFRAARRDEPITQELLEVAARQELKAPAERAIGFAG